MAADLGHGDALQRVDLVRVRARSRARVRVPRVDHVIELTSHAILPTSYARLTTSMREVVTYLARPTSYVLSTAHHEHARDELLDVVGHVARQGEDAALDLLEEVGDVLVVEGERAAPG